MRFREAGFQGGPVFFPPGGGLWQETGPIC